MSFQVLMVCTGNICRSAVAEAMLASVTTDLPVVVESAGLLAVDGGHVPEPMLLAAQKYGISGLEQHRGRPLSKEMVAAANLVLTATLEHRATVVRLLPRASSRIFTLREFARLTTEVAPEDSAGSSLDELIEEAAAMRGQNGILSERDCNIPDPYGLQQEQYDYSAKLIDEAIRTTAGYLHSNY